MVYQIYLFLKFAVSLDSIRVITKLPNTEQSSKGNDKTHKSTNRQNQSTTENCENHNGLDLVQAFPKKASQRG